MSLFNENGYNCKITQNDITLISEWLEYNDFKPFHKQMHNNVNNWFFNNFYNHAQSCPTRQYPFMWSHQWLTLNFVTTIFGFGLKIHSLLMSIF